MSVYKLDKDGIPQCQLSASLLLQNDLLLLNALNTLMETIFYSKWPSLTQRGLDDYFLKDTIPNITLEEFFLNFNRKSSP